MATANPELQNFSAYIFQEVNQMLGASEEGVFREVAFTQSVMEMLSDAGETGNVQICTGIHSNRTGNRIRKMNGYGLWDNYETLDIFISDYRNGSGLYTLDKSRITTNLNLATRYLDYAWKGEFDGVEDSAGEKEFLESFATYKDQLLRVRLILLTNGLTRAEVPELKKTVQGLTIVYEVWDLERIYQLWSSGKKRDPIAINLPDEFGQRIQCLAVHNEIDRYSCYMAVIPGQLLADLYDRYGSRLLEQNVRVYLQNKGKVNKEIRKTILDSPGMFMAYNNGISATATGISFIMDPVSKKEIISTIEGLQIVNGGQTTSSIYYTWKKDRKPPDGIFLQMKITLLKDNKKTAAIVNRISRYANSQNKVSETDLTSNQTFHVLLEEISRTTWTPSVEGSSRHTRWYYERAKGQYQEDINRERTPQRKKNFKEKNPSWQVIRKEEFAKFRNTWNKLPYMVARLSQKNYLHFMDAEGKLEPTRKYFRETVAIAVLFKTAERRYGKKPEAMGDLRFIVVPYTLAWLNHHTEGKIDLELIWTQQEPGDELYALLGDILLAVNAFFINEKPAEYTLTGEWAKKEDCWLALKAISPDKWKIDLKRIKKYLSRKENAGQDMTENKEALIREVPVSEWKKMELYGKETGKLDPLQVGVVRNVISRLTKGKPFSGQLVDQAEKVLALYKGQGK